MDLIENLKADFRTTIERTDECIEITQPILDKAFKYLQVIGGDILGLSAEEIKALATPLVVDFQPVLGTYRSELILCK